MNRKGKWLIGLVIIMLLSFIVSGFFFLKSGLINLNDGTLNENLILELENSSIMYSNIFSGEDMKNSVRIEKSISHNLNGIKDLNITLTSADINVQEVDSKEASFVLTGFYLENEYNFSPEVELENLSSTLKVKISNIKNSAFSLGQSRLDLTILLPKEFGGNLNIESTSGNIRVKETTAGSLDIKSTSGSIDLEDSEYKKFNLKSTSGKIELKNVLSEKSNIESTSGNVEVERSNIDSITTLSGKIESNLFERDSYFQTASGNLDLDYIESNIGIKMYSVSGKLRGMKERDGYPTITIKTISGNAFLSRGN